MGDKNDEINVYPCSVMFYFFTFGKIFMNEFSILQKNYVVSVIIKERALAESRLLTSKSFSKTPRIPH